MNQSRNKSFFSSPRTMNKQGGFSLIEILVSLGIIGVGLVGLAMTQAQGMKFGTGAYSRTQATIMAYNIIDRMRVHATEMRRQKITNNDETYFDYISNYETDINSYFGAGARPDCLVTPITDPDALQANFVNCWAAELLDVLPSASAEMTITNAAADPVDVEVSITWIPRAVRETAAAPEQRTLTWNFRI